MGLFDWLFGRRPSAAQGAPPPAGRTPPKVVGDLGDDSPWVLLDTGGTVTVMDREMYDYLYGTSTAPDPAQRDLDELLPAVTRVRVLSVGMYRGKPIGNEVLIDTTEPARLDALRGCFRIVEDPATFNHCACLGGPTLELFRGEELAATVSLQHGQAIRWKHWKHDARLEDGSRLNTWLTANGLEPSLLDCIFHNQYQPNGMLREGPEPLSPVEQRLRLIDNRRLHDDLPGALQECEQILKEHPDVPFAHALRGLYRHIQGDHAGCLSDCERALASGWRSAEVHFIQAVALDMTGHPEEALDSCTAALAIEPRHANALNSRGLIRARKGLLDEALADLNAAIAVQPKWALPYLTRAQVHLARRDLDSASADCTRIIELEGETKGNVDARTVAGAYWFRAQANWLQGDRERAEADRRDAIKRNPDLGKG
jgi:tetratricopeptide (TPR) repeat protein